MKKSKKIIALVCALLQLVSFAVYAEAPQGETKGAAAADQVAAESTEETTAPELNEVLLKSLQIGETSIAEYTIVYAENTYADLFETKGNEVLLECLDQNYPIYQFNKETAERLAALIYRYTGKTLDVQMDEDFEETDKEILIGKTNREESELLKLEELGEEQYTVSVSGDKLVICGGLVGTTWHAVDYIETELTSAAASEELTYAFASDFSYAGEYQIIRIGCIGDSITYGAGASNFTAHYVSQLRILLWKDAVVYGFGLGGMTMCSHYSNAYKNCAQFKLAEAAAEDIDIFTIMLGTNDAVMQKGTWNKSAKKRFVKSCMEIMQAMQNKNENVRFEVASCPYNEYPGIAKSTECLAQLAEDMIPELNEAGYVTTFFDMYAVTDGHGDWMPDTVHPNDEGYRAMAEAWAEHLEGVIAEVHNAAQQ